jgi:hypothetical protein
VKTLDYGISWLEPSSPNGLVYFYTIHIDQSNQNGPKDERCVGHDTHSVNVSLLPKTNYRLRIITYTIARLNHEYDDNKKFIDDSYMFNRTNLFYQLLFTTIDLPSKFAVQSVQSRKLRVHIFLDLDSVKTKFLAYGSFPTRKSVDIVQTIHIT